MMSWGIKITILYLGFVALIVTMVSFTMREKTELVSKNYYEQELKYQERIDRTERTRRLAEPLSWTVKPGTFKLSFPSLFKGQKIKGNLEFFRPSDAALDRAVLLDVDTLLLRTISTEQFAKGLYKVQLNWEVNKITYYNEGIIQIN
ncbi:MAG: FixH family protein [Bacteroidia bacterium]